MLAAASAGGGAEERARTIVTKFALCVGTAGLRSRR